MKPHLSHRHPPRAPGLATLALAALIAGCGSASAPTHFHTLMPPPSAAADRSGVEAALHWEILPIQVPAQVDQPQWVVRVADGSLVVVEQERWIAPLGDEIRGAVVERLTKSFGASQLGPSIGSDTSWRIRIDVQRFDLMPDREARLEADWSLRSSSTAVSCHVTVSQPVGAPGYVALARAQQQAVTQLADTIGTALRASSKGQPVNC